MELSRYPRHRMRSFRAGNPSQANASSRSSLVDRATSRVIDLNAAKLNLDKALSDMLSPQERGFEQAAIGALALKLLNDESSEGTVTAENNVITVQENFEPSPEQSAVPIQLPIQAVGENSSVPSIQQVDPVTPELPVEKASQAPGALDFLADAICTVAANPVLQESESEKTKPSEEDYLQGLLALDATISGLANSLRSAQAPARSHASEVRAKQPVGATTNAPQRHSHAELSRSRVYIVKRRARSVKRPPRVGLKPPTTQPLSNGRRVEMYEHGASVVKDALGRVVEVRSHIGHQLFLNYTPQGNLQSFCRLDAYGNLHSVAEQDKHGLVVRGPNGEVQAAGEYMSAGPAGCLTIHRFDGQFWSIDLVLGTYTERRLIRDRANRTHCLTAIFAYDGFRMMTRFQTLPAEGTEGVQSSSTEAGERDSQWRPINAKAVLRFYGRDGSMIEFDSDENLEALKPKRIAVLKGRNIGRHGQAKGQARTAWDAIERYLGFDANRV